MKTVPYKSIIIVICVLGLAGAMFLIPSPPSNAGDANGVSPQNMAGPAGDQTPAVTINGTPIPEAAIAALMQQELMRMSQQSQQIPPQYLEQFKAQMRGQILQSLIAEQLMLEQIEKAQVSVTDEEVIAEIQKTVTERGLATSLDEFKQELKRQGQTFDGIKVQVEKSLSIQKLLTMQYEGQIDVNDADAQAYYTEHPTEFESPEQVKVSHILIAADVQDPNTDPNQVKVENKQKAEDLLVQLKAGKDFAELAQAHSSCPSAQKGGDLGMLRKGATVPPFEEAAFALKVGELSEVVETQFGHHIIKVAEHQESRVIPLDEAKETLIKKLEADKRNALTMEYIEALKGKATIVYPETASQG
jgi:peptidyl-prolyl cis-trans isomerase C